MDGEDRLGPGIGGAGDDSAIGAFRDRIASLEGGERAQEIEPSAEDLEAFARIIDCR
jgi:hypothetical protein